MIFFFKSSSSSFYFQSNDFHIVLELSIDLYTSYDIWYVFKTIQDIVITHEITILSCVNSYYYSDIKCFYDKFVIFFIKNFSKFKAGR